MSKWHLYDTIIFCLGSGIEFPVSPLRSGSGLDIIEGIRVGSITKVDLRGSIPKVDLRGSIQFDVSALHHVLAFTESGEYLWVNTPEERHYIYITPYEEEQRTCE